MINTMDRVTVLQDSWDDSAKTVSICSVQFFVSLTFRSDRHYTVNQLRMMAVMWNTEIV